jgi:hypothetical protein
MSSDFFEVANFAGANGQGVLHQRVHLPVGIGKLDCSGLTITAGFWNSHVHFVQRKWANIQAIPAAELSEQMVDMITRWGFPSGFDIGSPGGQHAATS